MLERRPARIPISAFFAGPACLHLILSPPFNRICGALQLTHDSCNRFVRRPLCPGPRIMCSLGYGVITHRENIRPPQQKGQGARRAAMIRFVCKARTRHSRSPSWAAGGPSRRPQSQYPTGWISSRPTLLGILGSYVGPHDCSSGQARQVQGPGAVPDRER